MSELALPQHHAQETQKWEMEQNKSASFLQPPPPPGIQAAHSQDTLSVRDLSVLTPVLGKVTRQVRLVPWSCGRGVSRISEEL